MDASDYIDAVNSVLDALTDDDDVRRTLAKLILLREAWDENGEIAPEKS